MQLNNIYKTGLKQRPNGVVLAFQSQLLNRSFQSVGQIIKVLSISGAYHSIFTFLSARSFVRNIVPVAATFSLCVTPSLAQAAKTNTWSVTAPHTATTSNGITVVMTPTTSFTGVVGGVMGSTNFWNDPFAAAPLTSIPGSNSLDFTTPAIVTQTVTFTFDKAVNNPVLHVERLGGQVSGITNSSNWQLTGSNLATLPSLARLSGNPQFRVGGGAFFRTSGLASTATGCSAASATAATDDGSNACGSVRVTGTGITSLTFTVTFLGGLGIGDGIEFVWSVGGSRVSIAKQSTFGTRAFSFSGTNGVSSVSLNTSVSNPATSTFFDIANHRQPITITEAAVSDYVLTGASCADQNAAAVPATLSGLTLSIAANAYRANQDIVCTFNNRRTPAVDLAIVKSNGMTTVVSGTSTTYAITITNNGPDAVTGAIVTDIPGSGITCPSANPVVITGSGAPSGSVNVGNLTGTGITLQTIPSGGSATLTFSCEVN